MDHFINLCPMQMKPVQDRFVFMDSLGDVWLFTPQHEPDNPVMIQKLECYSMGEKARRILVEL